MDVNLIDEDGGKDNKRVKRGADEKTKETKVCIQV